MSTIGRARRRRRVGRSGRSDAADRSDAGRSDDGRSDAAGRTLTTRVVRLRDVCVQHVAARLGLPVPERADLAEAPPDATLREAVHWWKARAPEESAAGAAGRARASPARLVLKTAWMTAITVLGLALSYGTVG
jgi:hypothetical protein